jgi:hypothetical protein
MAPLPLNTFENDQTIMRRHCGVSERNFQVPAVVQMDAKRQKRLFSQLSHNIRDNHVRLLFSH